MSLYGAMMTGISGLDANSAAMSIYSSNIANVNTVGYKDVAAQFQTLLTGMFGNEENASVLTAGAQNVTQQGLLQQASSPTDLAISGNGFFVVSNTSNAGGAQYYTRAGNFNPDVNGNLQNGAGFYLMGWPVDAQGNVQQSGGVQPINVSNLSGKAEATQNVTLQENLDSSDTAVATYNPGDMTSQGGNPPLTTPDFSQTVNVYDSQGGVQQVTVNWVKVDGGNGTPNTWAYEVDGNAANIDQGQNGGLGGYIASGTVTFGSDGSLATVNGSNASGDASINIPWISGMGVTTPQAVSLNLGTIGSTNGVTQFDSPSVVNNTSVDGALFGSLTGISVDSSGFVTANFSNGLSEKIYQVPLATFTNPNGLSAVSGDAYQASSASGTANINAPNTGASGAIASSQLEGSTVDLATEFTNLITTQRAYSASARIVTTADQMLQQLEQLPST